MRAALTLARRGLGTVFPNPAVGCVMVRDGAVIGRGWTQPGGRPHAETEALGRAGDRAKGATAYITLEPCAHHGETPPCADALVDAGIRRAVIALNDPDPRVDGGGIRRLMEAGIDVDVGICEAEAAAINAGFFRRVRDGRPQVTLKLATSLDGRIATHTGHSRWVTGETARQMAHGLRARHDAILVGSGTAVQDDPDTQIVVLPEIWLGPDEHMKGRYPELMDWIRRQHKNGASIYSACSGAVMLAETGLLNECDATSHWGYQDLFRKHYPKVRFRPEPNLAFADSAGQIVTAGGTTSWHELAIQIISQHCSPSIR